MLLQQIGASKAQDLLHDGQRQRCVVEPVAFQKSRQLPVGVERKAAPACIEQRAGKQGVEQGRRFGERQQSAREQRDLAFEHRVEMADLGTALRQVDQVVAVEQAVVAPAALQRGIDQRQQRLRQVGQQTRRRACRRAASRAAIRAEISLVAPGVEHAAVGIQKGPARRAVVHHGRGCGAHDVAEVLQGLQGRRRQRKRSLGARQRRDEDQEAPQVGQRHHRQPVADQRVVGVVPFRPLRVQPQAATGHQAAGLGQHDDRQLLGQGCQHGPVVVVADQQTVGADAPGAFMCPCVGSVVEHDGCLGLRRLLCVRLEAVGQVGKAVQRTVPQAVQQLRVVGLRGLQELQQVDHLVVAPVADVAPGVVVLDDLPVDAVAADAIGVVAVGRHRAEEGFDHRPDIGRVAGDQCFPVLENVAPVALVVDDTRPGRIAHADRELVPRPARVTVAAAEGQRQIAQQQPFGLRPAGSAGRGQGDRALNTRRPGSDHRRELRGHGPVALVQEGQHVLTIEGGAVGKDTAAHAVEQHIGTVVCRGHGVARGLQRIGVREQVIQAGGVGVQRRADLGWRAATGLQRLAQFKNLHLRARRIDDLMPFESCGIDGRVEVDQEGAAAAACQGLGLDAAAATEVGQLVAGQQGLGSCGHACMPGNQGLEGLLGLGAIPDLGVQREQAQASTGGQFVPLVGVGEHAHRGRVCHADTGRDQVEQAVQHLHLHWLFQRDEAGRAHQTQARSGRPFDLEAQVPRRVLLAKAQPRAREVLPHRARTGAAVQQRRKGLPQFCVRTVVDADPGARPGVLPALVDAVDRLVGEERPFRVATAGCQRTGGGDEGPDITVAGQGHEEGRLLVVAGDAVPGLPVVFDEAAVHGIARHGLA